MCPKMFSFQNLVLVLEIAILEQFWWKYSHGPLGNKKRDEGEVLLMVGCSKSDPDLEATIALR